MSRITSAVIALFLCAMLVMAAPSIAHAAGLDGYKAIVSKSESRRVGESFAFSNLSTGKPLVTYPSGTTGEAIKVFENGELLVLIVVAQLTGSTETYYLSKKAHRFTLIEVTTFDAAFNPAKFSEGVVRPKVTYGKLN